MQKKYENNQNDKSDQKDTSGTNDTNDKMDTNNTNKNCRCHQASFLGQEYLFFGGILCKQVGLSCPVDQNAAFLD